MLESNLSAVQGLQVDGRAMQKLAPAFQLFRHQLGKDKAINSMPKLCFGGKSLSRNIFTHLAANNNLMRTVDEPVAD